MSVDLTRLPADEEIVRTLANRPEVNERPVQNVLDALNWFRCKAKFAEQELTRANAELIEVRNSAEHNRIFRYVG